MKIKHYGFSRSFKSPEQGYVSKIVLCLSAVTFPGLKEEITVMKSLVQCSLLWQQPQSNLHIVLLVSSTHLSSYFPKQLREEPEKTLLGKDSDMGKFWCTMQVACSSQ